MIGKPMTVVLQSKIIPWMDGPIHMPCNERPVAGNDVLNENWSLALVLALSCPACFALL